MKKYPAYLVGLVGLSSLLLLRLSSCFGLTVQQQRLSSSSSSSPPAFNQAHLGAKSFPLFRGINFDLLSQRHQQQQQKSYRSALFFSTAATTTVSENAGDQDGSMEVWCDCRFSSSKDVPKNITSIVDAVLIRSGGSPTNFSLQKYHYPTFVHDIDATPGNKHRLLNKDGQLVGTVVNITSAKGQQEALAAIGSVQWIVAFTTGEWRMIPAENLIGAASRTGTKIAFVVQRVLDVIGLSQALEIGVDALIVRNDATDMLWEAVSNAKKQRLQRANTQQRTPSIPGQVRLPKSSSSSNAPPPSQSASPQQPISGHQPVVTSGVCWRMTTIGSSSSSDTGGNSGSVIGDRVCVDFVQMLKPSEGCWVGSSSKVMALVLSEAAESSFVPSRPFRVNAGPVHSYICLADGISTKYLCELAAGDEVLVYDVQTGKTRSISVGRLKIEVRPCILVGLEPQNQQTQNARATSEAGGGHIFLQQAETVRLGRPDGGSMKVTDLEIASTKKVPILLRVASTGTHVGGRYTGKVDEL